MYIIELLAKMLKNRNNKSKTNIIEEENEQCEHVYFAIDSSSDYLACNKCGNVIKNYKKNFFIK